MLGLAALAFAGGLVAGSFIGMVAHRVPRGESIVGPRSRCPRCGARIAAYDNVPVISWLLLRGRCRECGGRISARYPLVELAVGALFAATVLILQEDGAELALGLVLVSLLAAVTLTDLERRVIPNAIVLAGAVVGIAIVAAADPGSFPERAIAAAVAGGVLLLGVLARPGGMGMGDVKLAALMGLFLGRAVAVSLIVGLAAGALVGVGLMLRHGASARKRALAFAPFLALGGIVGLWFGDGIIDWYQDTFFRD